MIFYHSPLEITHLNIFLSILLFFNNMVIPRRSKFFIFFYFFVIPLSCYDIWFLYFVILLPYYFVFYRLVATFYLYTGNSDDIFDQI